METETVARTMGMKTEYLYEKAKEKSREFLRDILGQELFNKFTNDRKIEIESNGNTYELDISGRVINKTTRQSYCIMPDRSDYPDYDVVAIKYAWLKYGLSTVERVANRTSLGSLDTHTRNLNDRETGIGYDAFVHMMESKGWAREQITIDENDTNMVSTHSVPTGYTRDIISIRCPAGRNITVMGTEQVPNGADPRIASRIALNIIGENGIEIPGNTRIRLTKIKPSTTIVRLVDDFYSTFSINREIKTEIGIVRVSKADHELYRWRRGIMLYGEERLNVTVVNTETTIRDSDMKFIMDTDLWTR